MKKFNVPNILTLSRVILVPVFMALVILPEDTIFWRCVAAAVFFISSLTDLLDGNIARRQKIVTNFGKFLDPLADKFHIIGALLALIYKYSGGEAFGSGKISSLLVWAAMIVVLRELAVTSMRLVVVKDSGIVVSASIWGKVKTTTQVVCIMCVLLEPVVFGALIPLNTLLIFSYLSIAVMTVTTILSGYKYIKDYWAYLDPAK